MIKKDEDRKMRKYVEALSKEQVNLFFEELSKKEDIESFLNKVAYSQSQTLQNALPESQSSPHYTKNNKKYYYLLSYILKLLSKRNSVSGKLLLRNFVNFLIETLQSRETKELMEEKNE